MLAENSPVQHPKLALLQIHDPFGSWSTFSRWFLQRGRAGSDLAQFDIHQRLHRSELNIYGRSQQVQQGHIHPNKNPPFHFPAYLNIYKVLPSVIKQACCAGCRRRRRRSSANRQNSPIKQNRRNS